MDMRPNPLDSALAGNRAAIGCEPGDKAPSSAPRTPEHPPRCAAARLRSYHHHGVFAPNHTLRDTVVRQAGAPPYPFPRYRRRPRGERRLVDPTDRPDRTTWAQLLARVFLVNVLTCPRCQGRRPVARR
jgi:hypothetical protein